MRTELGRIDGDLAVAEDTILVGVVSGSVTVKSGATFNLAGQVGGNHAVEAGASADLMGVVGGDVVNSGGNLTVQGMVRGTLRAQAGHTKVDEKAIVTGGIEGSVEKVKLSSYVPWRGKP